MKVITTLTLTVLISITALNNSYASLQDCISAGENLKSNPDNVIKQCKDFANDRIQIVALLGSAYGLKHQYKLSSKYLQQYINYYQSHKIDSSNTTSMLGDAYQVLGNYYYFGKIPNKVQKGLQYITQGAELGNATAQKQLGDIYASDHSAVPANIPLAYQWYKIAEANNNQAAENAPLMQKAKLISKQDPYCIALGQDNVGQAYYEGIGGLEQSTAKALDWLKKAASTDPNVSQVNLDLAKLYYLNGDKDKAFTTAQKAATQPLAQAMQYLGTLYQKGSGTEKNPVKAYAYLSLAVELYNNPATQFWQKYAAPCRPNYEGRTKEFNVKVAKQQLSEISLNSKQKQQADKLIKQVKEQFKL